MRLFCEKTKKEHIIDVDEDNYPSEIGEEYNNSYKFPTYDTVHTDEDYVNKCCKCVIL